MNKININKIGRNILRLFAVVIILFYVIWRITVPIYQNKPIYLDVNDGYVLLGSIAMLIAIEAVKKFLENCLNKK